MKLAIPVPAGAKPSRADAKRREARALMANLRNVPGVQAIVLNHPRDTQFERVAASAGKFICRPFLTILKT